MNALAGRAGATWSRPPDAAVNGASTRPQLATDLPAADLLAALAAGQLRAAEPDPAAPDGWRIRSDVKAAILACFANRATASWAVGPFVFHDRANLPPINPGPDRRVVPGGTAIRSGAFLSPAVVVMPPSYVNVGAWIGEATMVDSHVLVGSCAQVGARVHLAAGVTLGGVLEPAGARPVIVEDDAFVGVGSADRPLVVPPDSVVVPGTRPAATRWARERGLAIATALIVKRRDGGTDARVALEAALR